MVPKQEITCKQRISAEPVPPVPPVPGAWPPIWLAERSEGDRNISVPPVADPPASVNQSTPCDFDVSLASVEPCSCGSLELWWDCTGRQRCMRCEAAAFHRAMRLAEHAGREAG